MARTAKRVFYGARDAFPIPLYIISDTTIFVHVSYNVGRRGWGWGGGWWVVGLIKCEIISKREWKEI